MLKDRSDRPKDTDESKKSGDKPEKQKPSLIESLKQKLQTKRQKLRKEDPNIYPMW